VYLTHSWNGEVQGLKAVPRDDRPYVPIVFFAFRIMVGIGLLLLATAVTGADMTLRTLVTPGSNFLPFSAKTAGEQPKSAA
jgi:cytochrome bd-type quinol oxidase subunit 1